MFWCHIVGAFCFPFTFVSLTCTESGLCLSGSLAKLGFAANILKVEEWEVKIDYPERQEKGWSREMCQ